MGTKEPLALSNAIGRLWISLWVVYTACHEGGAWAVTEVAEVKEWLLAINPLPRAGYFPDSMRFRAPRNLTWWVPLNPHFGEEATEAMGCRAQTTLVASGRDTCPVSDR